MKTNVLCLSARNRRNNFGEVGCVQPKGCSVWVHRTVRWCTGLSGGAPDSVRCARLASVNWLLSGLRRRRTAINHQTVRWCTELSGEPTVGRANNRPRNLRETRGRANGQKGAPDYPVCTGHVRCANGSLAANGRLRRLRKEIGHRTVSGMHRTVRCARRQKARIAFPDCSQRLLAALGL